MALPALLESGAVKRPGRGRPRLRPDRLAGDKGYSSRTVRRYLHRRGIQAIIPTRRGEFPNLEFDPAAYRERNRVERFINRLALSSSAPSPPATTSWPLSSTPPSPLPASCCGSEFANTA